MKLHFTYGQPACNTPTHRITRPINLFQVNFVFSIDKSVVLGRVQGCCDVRFFPEDRVLHQVERVFENSFFVLRRHPLDVWIQSATGQRRAVLVRSVSTSLPQVRGVQTLASILQQLLLQIFELFLQRAMNKRPRYLAKYARYKRIQQAAAPLWASSKALSSQPFTVYRISPGCDRIIKTMSKFSTR